MSLLGACTNDEASIRDAERGPDERPSRRTVTSDWDTLFSIGGNVEDTTLLHPTELAAGESGVSVYDAGRNAVLRFRSSGELAWRFGRRGAGPNEFQNVRDLEVDGQGRTWALDPNAGRITILARDGNVVDRISLHSLDHRAQKLIPLSRDTIVLFLLSKAEPFAVLNGDGGLIERKPFPWNGFERLPPLATQAETDADRDGDSWGLAFSLGDGFFGFRGLQSLDYRGWYVEPVSFPIVTTRRTETDETVETTRKVEEPEFGAQSVTVEDDRIGILFVGNSQHKLRLLDIYSLEEGTYLGSRLLPRQSTSIDVNGAIAYAAYSEPVPGIVAWRTADASPLSTGFGRNSTAAPR